MCSHHLSCALLAAVLLVPAAASARTAVSGGQFRDSRVQDASLLNKGRMEFGISFAGTWSRNAVTPEGAEQVVTTNTYLVPGLVVGYMVNDWAEARLLGGLQYLGSTTSVGDAEQSSTAAVFALQALAQRDFTLGIAGYAGLGGGGYVGSRSEPHPTETDATVSWSASGGLGQLLFGLLLQPGPHLLMRGGIRLDMLFGSETPPESLPAARAMSTFNVQALAELQVGWRFL